MQADASFLQFVGLASEGSVKVNPVFESFPEQAPPATKLMQAHASFFQLVGRACVQGLREARNPDFDRRAEQAPTAT